jgi:hypothetical protein
MNPAQTSLSAIRGMLAAITVDYDRLAELRDAEDPNPEDLAELAELEAAAGECANEDDALQRIQDDPLSLQVRSGWYSPGQDVPAPTEFELLLVTGGPAVRIVGELDEHGAPLRAWIEWQDWGTPWTRHYEPGMGDLCLDYATHFYFGD